MTMKITQDVIESYVYCRYKSYLKRAGEQGSLSDYEQLMRESRERVPLAGIKKLLLRHKEGEVLRGCLVTPAVLKRGVPLLVDATVETEEFGCRFDALQRVAGLSRLGNFHYVPVLCHEAERPDRKLRALLELLSVVLETAQGCQGGVSWSMVETVRSSDSGCGQTRSTSSAPWRRSRPSRGRGRRR